MPLSTREVLIVLRARDLASRDIAQVGTAFGVLEGQAKAAAISQTQQGIALAGIGLAFSVAGAAGLKFYADSTRAAIDYNKEVAYTATQVDEGGKHLKEIADIGREVAAQIPAPFKEMQASLYDIFSSTNANINEARTLLEAFAKGAVAGMTDVQTAGRATISIINAFKVPFQDVNHVMDVQFETVRLGVITYEQFASTIGRAIPSAVRAGQSFEDLGGMIAFMTRNGLSAAQAATSAARALDMLSNPVFADNMKAFGIEVTNAEGAFRPMVDIIGDLQKKFGDLAPAQRTLEFLRLGGEGSADALKQLGINAYDAQGKVRPFDEVSKELVKTFKGLSESQVSERLAALTHGAGGTIQAMRFLNLAVGDTNNLYRQLTEQIRNSGGAANDAYQLMRKTPAAQIQLLSNQWSIIKEQIGEGLIPVVSQFIGKINDLLRWWIQLDQHTKNTIATIGLVLSVFLTLTGVIVGLAGVVKILAGTMALLEGAWLPILGWVAGATAISAAIILLGTHFDAVRPLIKKASDAVDAFMGGFENPKAINDANSLFIDLGAAVKRFLDDYIIPSGELIKKAFKEDGLEGALTEVGHLISNVYFPMVVDGLTKVKDWLSQNIPVWASYLWSWISDAVPIALSKLEEWGSILFGWIPDKAIQLRDNFTQHWGPSLWSWIKDETPKALDGLTNFLNSIMDWLSSKTPTVLAHLTDWGRALYDWIGEAVPKTIDKLTEWQVALINWLSGPFASKLIDSTESLIVHLTAWIIKAIPKIIEALLVLEAAFVNFFLTKLLPASVEALAKLGIALVAGVFKIGADLVAAAARLPVDIFKAVFNIHDVKLDVDTINQILDQGIQKAAGILLQLQKFGGVDVKAAFKQIAEEAPVTAEAIVDAMDKAGGKTSDFKKILQQVQSEHDGIGTSAERAYRKATSEAQAYRGELDLQLGKVNDVQTAHDHLVLALDAVARQQDINTTSTDSLEVKMAKLHLTQQDVYRSASDLIEKVKIQGIAFGDNRQQVENTIRELETFKQNNPGVAASVDPILEKLHDLDNTHANPTVDVQGIGPVTEAVVALQNKLRALDGTTATVHLRQDQTQNTSDATGGIIGRAFENGGQLIKAASGVIKGFKTQGPTLVGEGNPNYPEFVIATDPKYRGRNLKLFAEAGHALNLYAEGGMIGSNVLPNFSSYSQLKALEELMGHLAPVAAKPQYEDKYGVLGALSGAMGEVRSALGDFAGIPGKAPSTGMILQSLGDTSDFLGNMLYGSGPGTLSQPATLGSVLGSSVSTSPSGMSTNDIAGSTGGMGATNEGGISIQNLNIYESNDPEQTKRVVMRALEEVYHRSRTRR